MAAVLGAALLVLAKQHQLSCRLLFPDCSVLHVWLGINLPFIAKRGGGAVAEEGGGERRSVEAGLVCAGAWQVWFSSASADQRD